MVHVSNNEICKVKIGNNFFVTFYLVPRYALIKDYGIIWEPPPPLLGVQPFHTIFLVMLKFFSEFMAT